jgi:hypothetical protein
MKTVNIMKEVNTNRLLELLAYRPQIPEAYIEDVSVKHVHHPPGANLIVVSMRNAIFMEQAPSRMTFKHGYREHQLGDQDGVWMTDTPQEIWQMEEVISRAHGNVLIGGLGLGVVSHLVGTLSDAKKVVTVERDRRVIDIVDPHIRHDSCEHCNIANKLWGLSPREADFIFLDTWRSTGETTWFEQVVPLRRICRLKLGRENVMCWNEEGMIGQLRQGAHKHVDLPPDLQGYHNTVNVVMHKAGAKLGLQTELVSTDRLRDDPMLMVELQHRNGNNPDICDLFERLAKPGTDEWEAEFGDLWDEALKDRADFVTGSRIPSG